MTNAESAMRMRRAQGATSLGAVLCILSTAAGATAPLELGGYVGGSFPLGASGLGNPYFDDQQPRSSITLGLRGAYGFRTDLAAEFALDYTPTSTVGALTAGRPGIATTLLGVHASGRYTFLSHRGLRPFGVAGASLAVYLGRAPAHYALQTPDFDVGLHWGLGVEYDPNLRGIHALRLDARHVLVPGQDRTYSLLSVNVGVVFDVMGGVAQMRAGPAPIAAVPASPQPVSEPMSAQPPPQAPVEEEVVEEVEGLAFELDSAEVRPNDGAALDALAARLRERPAARLEIRGHTDVSGVELRNTHLSRRRADAVKWELVDRGVAADRIVTLGLGATHPVASNDSAEGRARNRRIELRIVELRVAPPASQASGAP